MKRFTETEKWRDSWFQALAPDTKLVFGYMTDTCDAAGVWDPNEKLAEFSIGKVIDWPLVYEQLKPKILRLKSGKIFLVRFVGFQYGQLSPECKPHQKVFRVLQSHGITYPIDTLSLGYTKGIHTLEEEEEEENKEEEEDRTELELTSPADGSSPADTSKAPTAPAKSATQLRAEKLFRRRPSTPWAKAELNAWNSSRAAIEGTNEEEWLLLEWFYTEPQAKTYARHDLSTLLNNWTGEIDRARSYQASNGSKLEPRFQNAF